MATPTAQQLVDIESNSTYKSLLRMNVLNQAAYWKGIDGVGLANAAAAEAWYKSRSLAEQILDSPQVSIDQSKWSSKSMRIMKDLNLAGIDSNSTIEQILAAIIPHYEYIAVNTYEQERKKILF